MSGIAQLCQMSGLQAPHHMDNQQQVSFHFWNCQLTQACPKYSWDPENWATAVAEASATDALDKGERRQRRQGDGGADAHAEKSKESGVDNGESGLKSGEKTAEDSADNNNKDATDHKSNEKANGKANGGTNGGTNGHANDKADDDENGEEAATDADYMQHVLKVNACILGARASGIHLISVRTKCYQSDQPDTCPIVCIDPNSQRTLALGYEFVLDSQNEVTFELTEGTGPVWLTGLHQVRVHDTEDSGECEGEEEDDAEEPLDESMKDIEGEGEDDNEAEEDEVDEEEEEEDEEEEIRPPPKRVARASKLERPVASPKQPQRGRKAPAAKKTPSPTPSPPPSKAKVQVKAAKEMTEAGGKRGPATRKAKA